MSKTIDKHFKTIEHQDWQSIIINKKTNKFSDNKIKKENPENQKIKSIEKKVEEDDLKHKKITPEMKQKIIQDRCSIGLTQKELAQKCNLPLQVINEIETGKAIYNHQHINKIKRILKISFAIGLYVAVTGAVVYLMFSPFF